MNQHATACDRSGAGSRVGLWLPYLALVPLFLLVVRFSFLCDDAFISFRYARNLADGLGLRYNIGVEPPVEGYSEFLWVLGMSLFEWLRADVTIWSRILSGATAAALMILTIRFTRRRVSASVWIVAGVAFFLATLPPVAVWTTGGLATMPFTLLVFMLFTQLTDELDRRRAIQAAMTALAICLIRADGPYWVLLTSIVAAATVPAHRRSLPSKSFWTYGAITLLGFALYEIWRYVYHGALVPNTAAAKVTLTLRAFQTGADYVASLLLTLPSLVIVWSLSLFFLRRSPPLVAGCLAMATGTALYAVISGGDFMCWGRFLVPAMPFLALLFGFVLVRLGDSRIGCVLRAPFATVCLALALLPAWNVHVVPAFARRMVAPERNFQRFRTELEQWRDMNERLNQWIRIGRALWYGTQRGESLVHGNVGAVGYYSGLVIYDQFGLVSREPARAAVSEWETAPGHHRYVRASFFRDRNPTYFGARLVTLEDPSRFVPEWTPDASGQVHIRMFHLPEAEGFAANEVLILARWPQASVDP